MVNLSLRFHREESDESIVNNDVDPGAYFLLPDKFFRHVISPLVYIAHQVNSFPFGSREW